MINFAIKQLQKYSARSDGGVAKSRGVCRRVRGEERRCAIGIFSYFRLWWRTRRTWQPSVIEQNISIVILIIIIIIIEAVVTVLRAVIRIFTTTVRTATTEPQLEILQTGKQPTSSNTQSINQSINQSVLFLSRNMMNKVRKTENDGQSAKTTMCIGLNVSCPNGIYSIFII